MLRCNAFARIALCGMIAGYNGEPIRMSVPAAFIGLLKGRNFGELLRLI